MLSSPCACMHALLENIKLIWNLCGTRGLSANCSRGPAGLGGLIGLAGSNCRKLGPGPQLWGRLNECLKPALQRTVMCCVWFWMGAPANFSPYQLDKGEQDQLIHTVHVYVLSLPMVKMLFHVRADLCGWPRVYCTACASA